MDAASDAALSMQNVHFQHPNRPALLQHFNLTVAAGEMVALCGPSGSGKSTVLHLLAGFMQPNSGHISVMGQPAGTHPVAWMDQRPTLLQGSWLDNCRLTQPEVTPAAATTALTAAGLGELLKAQPQGLDTPLQEGGFGLSGGQARRLALARVFLSEAPIVLLDEPTTGLDAASEAFLIAALQTLAQQGRTLLIATHHPQLIAACDRQVQLSTGGHDALA
jgi:ATP-binding cassette subfamily C protein CydD